MSKSCVRRRGLSLLSSASDHLGKCFSYNQYIPNIVTCYLLPVTCPLAAAAAAASSSSSSAFFYEFRVYGEYVF
jgi:hypothetical protein